MLRSNRLWSGLLGGLLVLVFLTGCGGGGSFPVFPTAIEVTPAQPSIAAGTSVQFTAIGIYSNNTKSDITSTVLWKSSDTTVATINAQGLATSSKEGVTTVTASLGGITKSVTLTVTAATLSSLQVSPASSTIAKGTSQQFTAIGTFSDSTTQDLTTQSTWTSSNSAVASVGASGLAVSSATGSTGVTTITATFAGKPANASLTVTAATLQSVQVTPTNPSIAAGTTLQFKATGIFSDSTKQDLTASATWSSSTTAASISGGGLATGMTAGNSIITATFGGQHGSSTLTVTAATLRSIEVTPLNPSIARGTSQQFAALGSFSDNTIQDLTSLVTWVSSNTAVATISNAGGTSGLATSSSAGSTTITAAFAGVSGQTVLTVTNAVLQSIDVEPAAPTLPVGVQQQFTATGLFSDGTSYTTQDLTSTVLWNSDNAAAALISNSPGSKGLAVTVAAGSANITASFAGVTGSTPLTVIDDTLLEIQVTPADPTIPLILTQQFTATGVYLNSPPVDLTAQATWSSSNPAIAVVSNDAATAGLAKPLSPGGPVDITATFAGISGTTTLTVSPATLKTIAVAPASAKIAKGTVQQFTATGTFSDGSTYDVTQFVVWTSSAPLVASISNAVNSQGLATGLSVGTTTITAALAGVVSTPGATLEVTNATLDTIEITPADAIIAVKTNIKYNAIGHFSDTSSQDLSRLVVWRSSNTSVASISNATGTRGIATGVTVGGPINITASFAGKTGTTTLRVATGTLTGITILPTSVSLQVGKTQQFRAIGTYTLADGITTFDQDLTRQVIWNTSDSKVAISNNGVNTRGLISAVGVGGPIDVTARKPSSNLPAGSIIPATLTVTP